MLLDDLTLLVAQTDVACLKLRDNEHNPYCQQIQYYKVGEHWWNVSIPDGIIIKVELKVIYLKEGAQSWRNQRYEWEVWRSFEPKDIWIKQNGKKDSVEDEEQRIDECLYL